MASPTAHGDRTEQRTLDGFAGASDPLAGVDLPDRGVEWDDEPISTPDDLDVLGFEDEYEYPGGTLGSHVAGFVLGDAQQYVDERGERELTIPPSYARFEEFEPVVTHVSCSMSAYGFGVTADRLEAAIRFATGGGRYAAGELDATVCGGRTLIVRSPAGAFAVSVESVRGKPEDFEPRRETVAGMELPEHDESMLAGIECVAAELAEHADVTLDEYVGSGSSSHKFRTEGGETVRTSAATLGDVQKAAPEADVLDAHERETLWGETFEYELTREDLEYHVGAERFDGRCIGHRVRWDDPRIGARYGTDRPVALTVTAYFIEVADKDSYADVRIRDTTRRVAEFETENDGSEHPDTPT
jgi:hypothetical protein